MTLETVPLRNLSFGSGSTTTILNDHNAKNANAAYEEYVRVRDLNSNVDFQSVVEGLICDLHHLCDRNDTFFEDAYENAKLIYLQEIGENG